MKQTRILLVLICIYLPQIATADVTAIIAGQIIDGISNTPSTSNVVVIEDHVIIAIGDSSIIPTTAEVIDLKGATLLPGFIDSHAHPLISDDDYQNSHVQHSSAY